MISHSVAQIQGIDFVITMQQLWQSMFIWNSGLHTYLLFSNIGILYHFLLFSEFLENPEHTIQEE